MHEIRFQITSLSPLILPFSTGDPNMVGTLKYIPGTALRGIFAKQFIKQKNLKNAHQDDTFYRWFLKGDITFTNAYITSRDEYDNVFFNYPIPLSVQKKKRGTSIFDLIFEDEDFEEQTEPIEGYGRFESSTLYMESVITCLNFHHARDRERGGGKKGDHI